MKMLFACALTAAATACSAPTAEPANRSNAVAPATMAPPSADRGATDNLLLLSARADGAPVDIAVGQEFGVQLGEHLSVGYTWEAVDLPSELRASGRDSTVPPNVNPGDDSGLTTFRFVTLRPGTITLRMVNKFRGTPEGETSIRIVIR